MHKMNEEIKGNNMDLVFFKDAMTNLFKVLPFSYIAATQVYTISLLLLSLIFI